VRDLPSPLHVAGDIVMKLLLRTFVRDVSGATAIEYALLAAFLAMAIITGLTNIGIKLSGYFSEVSSAMK
jgi:pilus assembly protein Flp/PilA